MAASKVQGKKRPQPRKPKAAKGKEIKYDAVESKTAKGKDGVTVEKAKLLLGWQTEEQAVAEGGEKFGANYTLKDFEGNKVRLLNNPTNRPFRRTLALKYMREMLMGRWKFNGETIIIDEYGFIQNGQHRLVGLVFAGQELIKNDQHWKKYGTKHAPEMEVILVTGVKADPDTINSIDQGQGRSLGDVVFRSDIFGEGEKDKDAKRKSSILAGAARLAWIRMGGKTVSDAPNFPVSEANDFIANNPGLVDAVEFIYEEDGGSGAEGKRISQFLSLNYAAGLCYLMSTTGSDPDAYESEGLIDSSMVEKAQEFWVKFASGADLTKGDPILALRGALGRMEAGSGADRDEIVGTIVHAYNRWVDGEEATAKDIKVKKTKDENGRMILAETPRLGGLDVELEVVASE